MEEVGCECGLLAGELRSQFSSAVVFTSQKLMHTLAVGCHIDFPALLHHIGASFPEGALRSAPQGIHIHTCLLSGATPSEVQTSATGHFECLRQGLVDLLPLLDDRVFISLIRGLWDNVAKDLFLFVVDLREDPAHHVQVQPAYI